jgi:hypothetical protein
MDKITTYDYYSFMHRRVTFTKVDHKQNEISTRVATGWAGKNPALILVF